VGKRAAERRRTNTTTESGAPVTTVDDVVQINAAMIADARVPAPDPDPDWHPIALMQWEAAEQSGQRLFYEPSDWAYLFLLCNELSLELNEKVIGFSERDGEVIYAVQPMAGAKLAAIMKGFTALMVTEGDRRRLRLELERGAVTPDQSTKPADILAFRQQRLG
jgi:hypothetical protein